MTTLKQTSNGNVLYLQSGGPTGVINCSFLGLYETFRKQNNNGTFYVSRYGISSFLEGKLEKIEGDYSFLRYKPGSHFGSLRKMLPDDISDPIGKEIANLLVKFNISYVFCNGGNDSMDTAYKLDCYCQKYQLDCKVIGIPKTIDNDLYGCDHTPGYGTAAKYVANSTIAITIDEYTYKKGKILLLETMGRDSGYVAASSYLASLRGMKPDYIYVPEVPFDTSVALDKAIKTYEEKGHCVIVVSEGIRGKDGKLIASPNVKDAFGNSVVGGVGSYLSSLFQQRGYKARAVELNTLNRSSTFLPCTTDIEEAYQVGAKAYLYALEGYSSKMVTIERVSSVPYVVKYGLIDLKNSRKEASSMPTKYINEAGDNINDSFLEYAAPLIRGNEIPLDEDGLLK